MNYECFTTIYVDSEQIKFCSMFCFYFHLNEPFNWSNIISMARTKIALWLCRCIPRPHLGLRCKTIKFLDPTHAEYIWRKLNIDDGLVVKEVYNCLCLLTFWLAVIFGNTYRLGQPSPATSQLALMSLSRAQLLFNPSGGQKGKAPTRTNEHLCPPLQVR